LPDRGPSVFSITRPGQFAGYRTSKDVSAGIRPIYKRNKRLRLRIGSDPWGVCAMSGRHSLNDGASHGSKFELMVLPVRSSKAGSNRHLAGAVPIGSPDRACVSRTSKLRRCSSAANLPSRGCLYQAGSIALTGKNEAAEAMLRDRGFRANYVGARAACRMFWEDPMQFRRDWTRGRATLSAGTLGVNEAQLIATHNATMECYRRAMIGEQTLEGRRENLNGALTTAHANQAGVPHQPGNTFATRMPASARSICRRGAPYVPFEAACAAWILAVNAASQDAAHHSNGVTGPVLAVMFQARYCTARALARSWQRH
jgi:hypothetical protein